MNQASFQKSFEHFVKILIVAVLCVWGISSLQAAWVDNTNTPPNANALAPIHVGSDPQTKAGNLTLSAGSLFTQGIHSYLDAYFDTKVGIGTTTPTDPLQVKGNARATQLCLGDTSGSAGCISSWSAAGGAWTTSGTNIYNSNTGNVGIGTTTPATKLDVNGTIKTTGFRMPTGATSGSVLSSDANGNGTWLPTSSQNTNIYGPSCQLVGDTTSAYCLVVSVPSVCKNGQLCKLIGIEYQFNAGYFWNPGSSQISNMNVVPYMQVLYNGVGRFLQAYNTASATTLGNGDGTRDTIMNLSGGQVLYDDYGGTSASSGTNISANCDRATFWENDPDHWLMYAGSATQGWAVFACNN
ncbi:MAG: hypothetical protein PHV42_02480 [Candidatus Pacebacteria bacterium]|nr:hypothetical protein [Candidatus Paceibacterota bacterium]